MRQLHVVRELADAQVTDCVDTVADQLGRHDEYQSVHQLCIQKRSRERGTALYQKVPQTEGVGLMYQIRDT